MKRTRKIRDYLTAALCASTVAFVHHSSVAQPAGSVPILPPGVAEKIAATLTPAPTVADFAVLFRSRRFAEVERVANARLSVDPKDAVSLVAKSSAIVGVGASSRLDEAASLAERCVEAQPNYSNCHEALGNALGTKAMTGGITSALGYATKIRDAYKRAVELSPTNHMARFSLLQYYSAAPSFLGGGKGRAKELVEQTRVSYPDAAKLLNAAVLLGEENFSVAEQLALEVDTRSNDDLAQQQRVVLSGVGAKYVNDRKYADAQRVFTELQRRYPRNEIGVYGLGRVQASLGKHLEAVALYDEAIAIYPGATMLYRRAQSLQALGDKAAAIKSYDAALAARPALGKSSTNDAKEQLAALKS